MKIKQYLEDFKVKEVIKKEFIKTKGEYEVYKLTKKGIDTLSVIRELRKKFKSIGYAGLKDKHGITEQYITIKKGTNYGTPSYEIKKVGYCNKHLNRGDNIGNEFIIRVELDNDEKELMKKNAERIRKHGFKNYYDKQRIGHELKHTSIVHYLLKKDYKTALLRYYIHKSKYAGKKAKRKYKESFKNWGDYKKCYELLKKHVKAITLRPLKELMKNEDYLKAVKKIPRDELELLIAGYQAILFNEKMTMKLPVINLPKELGIKPRKGLRKTIVKPTDLKIEFKDQEAVISFKLPKGVYATILLKTLLKT